MTNIVIIGAGAVGASVAEALAMEEYDVTIIDESAEILEKRVGKFDIRAVHGDATDPELLEQINIEDAELLLAVTNQDDTNILVCQLAVLLGNTPKVVARIRNQEINKRRNVLFGRDDPRKIPIDTIISPERLVTEHIIRLIDHPGALQLVEFAKGKIQLIGIQADVTGKLVGHKIRELKEHIPNVNTRVAAVYHHGRGVIPKGDTIIAPGDVVFFIATPEHIADVVNELRVVDTTTGNRIMLVGAGNIGLTLAKEMSSREMRVVLIEKLEKNAIRAADHVPKCLVICADATDSDMLERENVGSMEVFCAVTEHDETNILSAMMAKKLGAKRTMALVNNSAYVDLLENSGVDIVISPNLNTVSELLTFVRKGTEVVHSLRRGAAEAIETVVRGETKQDSKVIGRTVEELGLPEGTTVGAILRDDEVVIAHHDTVIEQGDHIILFVVDKSGKTIKKVQKLFEPSPLFL